jgi:PIN domain nuclease of toxin-antitoxin system
MKYLVMSEKELAERVEKLEQAAHYHNVVERVDCNPEKAEILKMKLEDIKKAKKSGKIHGDPILIIE